MLSVLERKTKRFNNSINMKYQSPLDMLYHWEKSTPNKVYLKQPIDGIWHTWTWQQAAQEVRQAAASLRSLGLPQNSHIALLSKNCAHWMICDLAIMMAGHVSIPLYPNLQQENVQQILERSESTLAAYRRVVVPTASSATLVNKKG